MSAKSTTEEVKAENVVDDLPKEEVKADTDKLAALKAKSQAKQQESKMSSRIIAPKSKSIQFGVIGSGQAGNRLASCLQKLSYSAIAINTAIQDLRFIDLPDSNKLLLEYGLGGAAKEIEIGRAAAESHRGEIIQLINDKLSDAQVFILCLSLGGGSGAGSCETLVDILSEMNKPLVVMTILPSENDDAMTKANSIETLSKLAKLTQSKKVNNLIVVDNAKIEAIYKDINPVSFFDVANKAIVEPLDIFNTLSLSASSVKGLDPMEWAKLLIEGSGCTVYGELSVSNFKEDTALAEAIVTNLDNNLLSSSFDLSQAQYVGVIFSAPHSVWSQIPNSSLSYAMSMINDRCKSPKGVFKGIYTVENSEQVVKVYSMFSGLGLPEARISELQKNAQELSQLSKNKDDQRNINLNLDTGKTETISAAQKVKDKISQKSSAFGKLVSGVVDRRK